MPSRRLFGFVFCAFASTMFVISRPSNVIADEVGELNVFQAQVSKLTQERRYREAEPIAKAIVARAERTLTNRPEAIANYSMDLAGLYFSLGQYDDAEPVLKRVLILREKHFGEQHADTVFTLNALALVYNFQSRYEEAEKIFKRVLAIRIKLFGDRHPEVAQVVVSLALIDKIRARYPEAEAGFRRALTIYETAPGDQRQNVAACLNNLAIIMDTLGRYDEAEALYKRAIAEQQQAVGDQHPAVARNLNNLAELYRAQSRNSEAEPLYKKVLGIYEKSLGNDHPDVATTLSNLALLYQSQGRYSEAEQLLKRALAISHKSLSKDHPDLATRKNNLADLYRDQGRAAEAEPLLKEALAIYEKKYGGQHPAIAICLTNLADVEKRQRRYSEAEPLLNRALTINRAILGNQHPNVANSLSIFGGLYQTQGRDAEAEKMYQQSLEIREKSLGDHHPKVAECLTNLAQLRFAKGRYDEAESFVDRSISIFNRAGSAPLRRIQSHLLRARIGWKKGLKNEAIQDLRQAMEYAEQSRHETSGADKERAEHFSQFSSTFEQMVDWQVEQGDAAESLQAIERSRARSLLDEMMRAGTDLNVGRSPRERDEIRAKQSQLKSRVAQFEKQWERASEADRDRLSAALTQARNELYEQYRDERNSSPVYRNLLSTSSGLPRISQLQRTLLASDSLALVYLFGEEGGYLAVLSPKEVRMVRLSIDATNAETLKTTAGPLTTERLRQILVGDDNTGIVRQLAAHPTTSKPEDQKQMTARLAALWPVLIPEAERDAITSGKYKRLIVIPDGPLALFPMETLVIQGEDDPEYLLDSGPPILYGPSLSVLFNVSTRSAPLPIGKQPVLTVADPIYPSEVATAESSPSHLLSGSSQFAAAGGSLPRLPFTSEESKAVADAFIKAGMPTGSLERNQATEASVRQFVTGRRIVHLACHGRTDQDHGNFFGALALTPGKQADVNSADDGFLTLPEIYELDMKGCELAILSACETNYGPEQQGEGVWTLSRGFLVSGARRVVASNWLVDDEAGARLVSYFCTAVAQDEKQTHQADYASSLQAAKKWTRNQSQWKHPYFWSTFVYVGPK